jgi:hypothetical protein
MRLQTWNPKRAPQKPNMLVSSSEEQSKPALLAYVPATLSNSFLCFCVLVYLSICLLARSCLGAARPRCIVAVVLADSRFCGYFRKYGYSGARDLPPSWVCKQTQFRVFGHFLRRRIPENSAPTQPHFILLPATLPPLCTSCSHCRYCRPPYQIPDIHKWALKLSTHRHTRTYTALLLPGPCSVPLGARSSLLSVPGPWSLSELLSM